MVFGSFFFSADGIIEKNYKVDVSVIEKYIENNEKQIRLDEYFKNQ